MLNPYVLPRAMPKATENLYLRRVSLQAAARRRSQRRDTPIASTSRSEAGEHNHRRRTGAGHLNRERSLDLVSCDGGLDHGQRGVHAGFRYASIWRPGSHLKLQQGRVDEMAGRRAQRFLESSPPFLGKTVGRVRLRIVGVYPLKPHPNRRAARGIAGGRDRILGFSRDEPAFTFPNCFTSDLSQRRSSIASAVHARSV